jgi:hypothetical protein
MTGAVLGSLLGGILLSIGSFLIYKWNKNKQKQKTIYENENYNDYSQEEKELPIVRDIHNNEATNNNVQEIIQISNTTNHKPTIIQTNDHYGQEIIIAPENENTTNHEPTIIPSNDHHGQEIMQTFQNENTTNNEPITSAPAVVNSNNYYYGQEVISLPNDNRLSSQILKDEILQAVKQEIGQNLKNEILQAVREENFNYKK